MSRLSLKRYIEIAEDKSVDESSRDDAISELAWTDNSHALRALYRIGSDKLETNKTLLASAGESIARIWIRRGWCSTEYLDTLMEATVDEILLHFRGDNESLLSNRSADSANPPERVESELTDFDFSGLID
jgi:hypothetical protein